MSRRAATCMAAACLALSCLHRVACSAAVQASYISRQRRAENRRARTGSVRATVTARGSSKLCASALQGTNQISSWPSVQLRRQRAASLTPVACGTINSMRLTAILGQATALLATLSLPARGSARADQTTWACTCKEARRHTASAPGVRGGGALWRRLACRLIVLQDPALRPHQHSTTVVHESRDSWGCR